MAHLEEERSVLEVVELSESEDEDFDYKAVEVPGSMTHRCSWSQVVRRRHLTIAVYIDSHYLLPKNIIKQDIKWFMV